MTKKSTLAEICRATFFKAVGLKRGAGSITEAKFAAELTKLGVTLIDEAGNLHFDRRVMPSGKLSRSLFTAHTDTVHRGKVEGENKYKWFNTAAGVEWVKADGDVLGADDGAGLAILTTMMSQKVPGYYIFFRSEECGGIGSSHFAKDFSALLKEFDRATAFDRRGYGDVISHQAGGRCCSDAFANALATALNDQCASFMYSACDGGVFTDTANLTDGIPECTNVSVAYDNEHTVKESQDMSHLLKLVEAACKLDWEALPTVREAGSFDDDFGYGRKSRSYLSGNAIPWASGWSNFDKPEDEDEEVGEVELLQAIELALYDHVYEDLVKLVLGFESGVYEQAAAKLKDNDYERYIDMLATHTIGYLCDIIKNDMKAFIDLKDYLGAKDKGEVGKSDYDSIRTEMQAQIIKGREMVAKAKAVEATKIAAAATKAAAVVDVTAKAAATKPAKAEEKTEAPKGK